MVVAKKRAQASPLKITTQKTDSSGRTSILYKVSQTGNKATIKRIPPAETNILPFDKWTMPQQEDGYIKCRKYDFL